MTRRSRSRTAAASSRTGPQARKVNGALFAVPDAVARRLHPSLCPAPGLWAPPEIHDGPTVAEVRDWLARVRQLADAAGAQARRQAQPGCGIAARHAGDVLAAELDCRADQLTMRGPWRDTAPRAAGPGGRIARITRIDRIGRLAWAHTVGSIRAEAEVCAEAAACADAAVCGAGAVRGTGAAGLAALSHDAYRLYGRMAGHPPFLA